MPEKTTHLLDQMWYLLLYHICIDFAVFVNPFFRAVLELFWRTWCALTAVRMKYFGKKK